MSMQMRRCFTVFFMLLAFGCAEAFVMADQADARSRSGGRSIGRSAPSKQVAPPAQQPAQKQALPGQQSGFGRSLAGGLLGGALGGMLFGSLFGMGGSGMGILPLLLLGLVGYFFYRQFMRNRSGNAASGYAPPRNQGVPPFGFGQPGTGSNVRNAPPPVPPRQAAPASSLEDGLALIRSTDPDFDPVYFTEVASDVFFKVQAGWMRRDLSPFGHLLGKQLADEYAAQFKEMEAKGELNKLESISIRKVAITDVGSENGEDFVTVLFTANLLDYTVDDKSGALRSGSMTEPVKFAEEWTWARPITTQDWRLESIRVVEEG